MWILLKLLRTSIHGPVAVSVPQEDAGKSPRELLGHLEECHTFAGPRWSYGEISVTSFGGLCRLNLHNRSGLSFGANN